MKTFLAKLFVFFYKRCVYMGMGFTLFGILVPPWFITLNGDSVVGLVAALSFLVFGITGMVICLLHSSNKIFTTEFVVKFFPENILFWKIVKSRRKQQNIPKKNIFYVLT